MKITLKMLKEGMKVSQRKIVLENETALKIGSGGLEVFSTPMLLAFMENSAFNLVESEMELGMTTVGISLNLKHLKSNRIGDELLCECELVKIEGKKLVFTIQVIFKGENVAFCEHERYIVDSKKFMSK